jgi:hypothetical protein
LIQKAQISREQQLVLLFNAPECSPPPSPSF